MRKLLIIALMLILALSLVACNRENNIDGDVKSIYHIDPVEGWVARQDVVQSGWFNDTYVWDCTDEKAENAQITFSWKETTHDKTAYDLALESYSLNEHASDAREFGVTNIKINGIDAAEYTIETPYGLTDRYIFLPVTEMTGNKKPYTVIYTFLCSALTPEWDAVNNDFQRIINSFTKAV